MVRHHFARKKQTNCSDLALSIGIASKYIKQKWIELKERQNKSIIREADINVASRASKENNKITEVPEKR